MKIHCIRLKPGQDLKKSLAEYATEHKIRAAALITCVGSLSVINLRMAGAKKKLRLEEKHEIVSMVGTLAKSGLHLHLSVSDMEGRVTGGHVLDGNIVNTTAEIVFGELKGFEFRREQDQETGYEELAIYPLG